MARAMAPPLAWRAAHPADAANRAESPSNIPGATTRPRLAIVALSTDPGEGARPEPNNAVSVMQTSALDGVVNFQLQCDAQLVHIGELNSR
jgi:hypothetical protein